MKYELLESPTNPGHWHVEAFDDEGECIKAVFSGPEAKRRAESYLVCLDNPRLVAEYLEVEI
jgi:quinol monooxygenase YgiN